MLGDRIGGYDQFPDSFFAVKGHWPVNIGEDVRRNVVFLGIRERGRFIPKATGFFATYVQDQHRFEHLVTAEHVVSGLLTKHHDIWMRANLLDGRTEEFQLEGNDFYFHPNNEIEPTDVAVMPVKDRMDDKIIEMRTVDLNGPDSMLPSDEFKASALGPGATVAISGLFRSHHGNNRNIPIVRMGNIAALPEEPVFTTYVGYIEAYLIEARSISGLSGSPVFVLREYADMMIDRVNVGPYNPPPRAKRQMAALLGLMHGHFDVKDLNSDVVTDDGRSSVHTGIGVVVPSRKILETMEHPDLAKMRSDIVAKLREGGATADLAEPSEGQDQTASDENPNHREDFTSLLNAAARTKRLDD